MRPDLSVVILAAGMGTRMKSKKAKVLHEAGGLPLIVHVVDTALQAAPPDRVVTVIGHQAETLRAVLGGKPIRFAEQSEQLGTGHALSVCREVVPDHVGLLAVLYGDCPLLSIETLRRLIETQANSTAAATVLTTSLDDPTGYGRVIVDGAGNVQAIVEHKVASAEQRNVREINSGIYCFNAPLLWRHLASISPNPVSLEYYLTDIVEILHRAGHQVRALPHADANELLGINTRAELAVVDAVFRARAVRRLMLDGVTVRKPETVTVDAQVEVGADTVIEPFAQLLGRTSVGEDCRIGAGSILRDATLGDGVEIAPLTLVESSRLENGAKVGPYARLRGGNHVAAGAYIGNFVELKNTNFGAGSKAGHLAYLGDSEIGRGANIGAGTIFCNYDGKLKHVTRVGPGAFVGSNSTLVAPVEIGEGAYVAAGSTITENVPADALGIGRSKQAIKEEWAKRRRERKGAVRASQASEP